MTLKKLSVLCIFLLSSKLFAASWGAVEEINQNYLHSTNDGTFVSQTTMINPDNCPRPEYYFLPRSNIHYDQIYAILVAARASKQKVQLHMQSCTATGWPMIQHIRY